MSPSSALRYVCIHGHFYQPPRENPFTGEIPREEGAAPYANFNEKIHAECYRPNSRLANFRHLSFDIGPTLATWLARHHPATLRRIVAQDHWATRTRGAGSAMAQSYHHTILPLDAPRDQRTQVRWGIRDFQYRFARAPLGLWLPETAVDLATLEVLAAEGILYTILAPWQAAEPVESGRPYTVELPSGRSIAVFFYDAELSGFASFNPEATVSAPRFVEEYVLPSFVRKSGPTQLALIATDGELYGHHQPFRDLFLQDLLQRRLPNAGLRPITLEGYLRLVPPAAREPVRLREATSWSCHHGLDRWSTSCGCVSGTGAWKEGLRALLDSVRDSVDGVTAEAASGLLADVWAARDDYIEVVLGTERPAAWLERHAIKPLTGAQSQRLLNLFEAQRYRQAMYASCAFFWEDLDRLEPRNAVANALQAIRLVENATGVRLEFDFRRRLGTIASWRTGHTAADILQPLATAS